MSRSSPFASLERSVRESARRSALARTRLVIGAFVPVAFALALAMLAGGADTSLGTTALALAALAWLLVRHAALLATGRPLAWLAPLDGAALVAVVAALDLGPATGVFFVGVFFRSLFGTRLDVAVNAVTSIAAYLLGGELVSTGQDSVGGTAMALLGLVFAGLAMRLVAEALTREDRTRRRERLLRESAARLVAARGRTAIHAAGMDAALAILAGRADARVVLWEHEPGGQARVVAAAGDRAGEVLGARMAWPAVADPRDASRDAAELRRYGPYRPDDVLPIDLPFEPKYGGALVLALPRASGRGGALVVDSDAPLPADVEDALRSLATLLILAIEGDDLAASLQRRERERRLAALIRNASDVITVVGPDRRVRYQTPSVAAVLGYEPGDLDGRDVAELIHPDDRSQAIAFLERAARSDGDTVRTEWRMACADGDWRQLDVVAAPLTGDDEDAPGIVLTGRDITERKALEERLAHQAFHDALTGLPNRALFRDRVEHAIARARREGGAAVLFVDLDDFKAINDTLGHGAGDRLLTVVAQRLRDHVRPGDTAARLGGDEFGVLLEGVGDPATARGLAERLLAQLERPLQLDGRVVSTGASIGVALAGPGAGDADALVGHADQAMYTAKSEGKGRVRVFEPWMRAGAARPPSPAGGPSA